jgi:hypothetical protein
MPNWNKIVASANAEKFKFPAHDGWVTREKVAEDLDCSPERVPEVLSVAIRSGAVETKAFTVWDAEGHRKVRMIGYREVKQGPPQNQPAQKRAPSVGAGVISRTGQTGTITAMRGEQMTVRWQSGQVTKPTTAAIKKQNLRLA